MSNWRTAGAAETVAWFLTGADRLGLCDPYCCTTAESPVQWLKWEAQLHLGNCPEALSS